MKAVTRVGMLTRKGFLANASAFALTCPWPVQAVPAGRTVEKLLVTGNHDWDGENCGSLARRRYPDPQERARHLFAHDLGGNWEKVFGEKYEPIFLKRIRGYVFK